MLGHLKAADFVNLVEGVAVPARHTTHLNSCPRCRETWKSMQAVHSEMTSIETHIPEPDWTHFRSSVRDELLSRSIQRQTVVRRWTGWTIRPAIAWALSLMMAIGITTITLLWSVDRTPATLFVGGNDASAVESTAEWIEAGPEKSLFDEVVSLGDEQQEQLRQMLESAPKEAGQRQ
jgi:hypothetical protein